jgi:hypothetical protein
MTREAAAAMTGVKVMAVKATVARRVGVRPEVAQPAGARPEVAQQKDAPQVDAQLLVGPIALPVQTAQVDRSAVAGRIALVHRVTTKVATHARSEIREVAMAAVAMRELHVTTRAEAAQDCGPSKGSLPVAIAMARSKSRKTAIHSTSVLCALGTTIPRSRSRSRQLISIVLHATN